MPKRLAHRLDRYSVCQRHRCCEGVAGSVVVKDIPSNVVAVGNPCRAVRQITDEDKFKSWDKVMMQKAALFASLPGIGSREQTI